jgi:hypothetical protein
MKLKTVQIPPTYKAGEKKVTRKYAWWPKRVEDKLIWLEHYELVEVKSMRPRIVFAGYYPLVAPWGWDFVEERLIKSGLPGLPDFKHPPQPPPPLKQTHMNLQKVIACQDDSCHWYVIPAEMLDTFRDRLREDDEEFDAIFAEYRTGGDLNNVQLWAEIK